MNAVKITSLVECKLLCQSLIPHCSVFVWVSTQLWTHADQMKYSGVMVSTQYCHVVMFHVQFAHLITINTVQVVSCLILLQLGPMRLLCVSCSVCK